jgi:hypothetical protein
MARGWVDGSVPDEMRQGVDAEALRELGVRVQTSADEEGVLTRVHIPRPEHIPAQAIVPQGFEYTQQPSASPPTNPRHVLSYDFPLLPGVQCHVALVGDEVGPEHLEKLCDYLQVATRRLRQQSSHGNNASANNASARNRKRGESDAKTKELP